MARLIVEAIFILALPAIAFLVGVRLMSKLSDHGRVVQRLRGVDQKPLDQRLAYDINAVQKCWGALDIDLLRIEQRFLVLLQKIFWPQYIVAIEQSLPQ